MSSVVFISSAPGGDELGRDTRARVERLAAALSAAGLEVRVGDGGDAARLGDCYAGVVCLTAKYAQLADAPSCAELASVVGALGRDRIIAVALEPGCARPIAGPLAKYLKAGMTPLDLSADAESGQFGDAVKDLITEVVMTKLFPSASPSPAGAAAGADLEAITGGASAEPAQSSQPASSPYRSSSAKAQSRSPPKTPVKAKTPIKEQEVKKAALSAAESAVGMTPSQVKSQAAAMGSPKPAIALPAVQGLRTARRSSTSIVELSELSVDEVAGLMGGLGLHKYAPAFAKAGLSGEALGAQTDESLQELGLGALHRRTLLGRLEDFKSGGVPASLLKAKPATAT
jgi:hypothetical protein